MKKYKIIDNPWMKKQIAGTNGRHYIDRIGKMEYYPQYSLPFSSAATKNEIMLDIGSGWGRWLVAGSRKGFIPVGIDINIEHAEASLKTLQQHETNGYVVVADLQKLPFRDNVFSKVWSFSVIQHTHYNKMTSCIGEIARVLRNGGTAKLEFPNKTGLRNLFTYKKDIDEKGEIDSLHVRYYSLDEYRQIFKKHFDKTSIDIHSFFGIGILPEDVKYVSWKNKIKVGLCLGANFVAKVLGLKYYADSVYINAQKETGERANVDRFIQNHWQWENLNVVNLIACPISGGPVYIKDGYVVSELAGVKYPIVGEIPVMLEKAAIPLTEKIAAQS